jgi:hypothetical protein
MIKEPTYLPFLPSFDYTYPNASPGTLYLHTPTTIQEHEVLLQ